MSKDPFQLMGEAYTSGMVAAALGDRSARILELEHDTEIVPLGSDPDHCRRCRETIRIRKLRADCTHEEIESVEITAFGDAAPRYLSHCRRCGLSMTLDHEHWARLT